MLSSEWRVAKYERKYNLPAGVPTMGDHEDNREDKILSSVVVFI